MAGNFATKCDRLLLDSEILIVVPARKGSKRLPGKNLKFLGGRSLLAWTDEAIRASGIDASCLLTTDCEEIAEAGRNIGWMVPFLRPASLASDTATSLDVVLHVLDWWQAEKGADPKYVMLLQVTSPFRGGRILKEGRNLLDQNAKAQAVVGVHRVRHNSLFQIAKEGVLQPLKVEKDNNAVVAPNGAFYFIRSEALREEKTFFPRNTLPLMMDEEASLDIDTPFDWSIAELILEKNLHVGQSS